MKILTYPNDLLRQEAIDVEIHDDDLHLFIADMTMCMLVNNGLGLAACQVGSDKNMFIYRKNTGQILVIINPIVLAKSGKYWSRDEQCLSLPGIKKDIKRAKMIKIQYVDNFGDEQILKAQNMEAVIIQHELDHLKGKLMIDK